MEDRRPLEAVPDAARRRLVRRSLLRSLGVVAVLLGGFAVLPLRGHRWWVGIGLGVALLVAIAPLTFSRLRKVLGSDRPVAEALEAVVQLFALLVVGFASIYFAMNRDGTQVEGVETRLDALYFTVTTLATVGFGDLVPVSQAARLVVTGQIVSDLIFVGLVVRVFARVASR